jgi:hypothetical protein
MDSASNESKPNCQSEFICHLTNVLDHINNS